ncbi:MAG TPA: MBL fold metallo-hydrolase [Elusimicrobiota bacterium]|nr:MBL fold metallo-hydrolase [Elusimicrobiota bacterium]
MIRLLDGVHLWSRFDPEKRFNFNGHVLKTAAGVVMVDPVPLSDDDLAYLETAGLTPDLLVITNRNHLRAREQVLARWKVPVVLHEAEVAQAGVPADRTVKDGDDLLGLRVVHLPGKSPGEIALLWPARRALLVGDALLAPYGGLKTVPDEKMDDPALLRLSLARLKTLDFDVLLVGDGDPLVADAKAAVAAFLR